MADLGKFCASSDAKIFCGENVGSILNLNISTLSPPTVYDNLGLVYFEYRSSSSPYYTNFSMPTQLSAFSSGTEAKWFKVYRQTSIPSVYNGNSTIFRIFSADIDSGNTYDIYTYDSSMNLLNSGTATTYLILSAASYDLNLNYIWVKVTPNSGSYGTANCVFTAAKITPYTIIPGGGDRNITFGGAANTSQTYSWTTYNLVTAAMVGVTFSLYSTRDAINCYHNPAGNKFSGRHYILWDPQYGNNNTNLYDTQVDVPSSPGSGNWIEEGDATSTAQNYDVFYLWGSLTDGNVYLIAGFGGETSGGTGDTEIKVNAWTS